MRLTVCSLAEEDDEEVEKVEEVNEVEDDGLVVAVLDDPFGFPVIESMGWKKYERFFGRLACGTSPIDSAGRVFLGGDVLPFLVGDIYFVEKWYFSGSFFKNCLFRP